MRTRPVFESYSAFVNHLYSAVNEEESTVPADAWTPDFKNLVTSLGSILDENAEKAFTAVRDTIRNSPTLASRGSSTKKALQPFLTTIVQKINSAVKDNDKAKVQFSDEITCTVQSFKFNNVVNGKIVLGNDLNGLVRAYPAINDSDIGKNSFKSGKFAVGTWANINDVFAAINILNLFKFQYVAQKPALNAKDNRWATDDGKSRSGSKISGTGTSAYVIFTDSPSITFTDQANAEKAKLKSDKLINRGTLTAKDEKIFKTFVFYGISDMVLEDPEGQEIPTTLIKPDFIVQEGEEKSFEIPISGTDAMFQQGKSELNTDNKMKTEQAISAAISEASSISSIEIIGGASFEGGLELNKKLVVGRATTVKTLIETLFPSLKDKVIVNSTDFSKIQPKDEPEKYPEWRKVYLKIKGTKKSESTVKEIKVTSNETMKSGSAIITQYTLTSEFYSDVWEAPKK